MFYTVTGHKDVDLASAKIRILNHQDDDEVSTGIYTADTVVHKEGAIPPDRTVEVAKLDLGKLPTGALLAIIQHHLTSKKGFTKAERVAGLMVEDVLEEYAINSQRDDAEVLKTAAEKKQEELVQLNP